MSRKTEEEFINEGFSEEELASMNDTAEPTQEPVQAEAAPEASTDAPTAEAPPAADPEPKMVDVRAVQEARAEARAAREEIARIKAEQAQFEARVAAINEAIAKQNEPPPPKVPTMDEEPIEYIEHRFQTMEQKIAAYEKAEAERTQQMQYERQQQAMIDQADVVLGQAVERHPDVQDAFQFAFKSIKDEITRTLANSGITGPEMAIKAEQMLRAEQLRYSQLCPRDPDQAAEFVRRNARYWGWGYQPQQAPIQQTQQVQQPTIQQRAEQQERHASLSGVQGASAPVKLDAKALASMSDAQYQALLKTLNGRKQLEEVFGGV